MFDSVPKFKSFAAFIEKEIAAGKFPVDSKLPGERELGLTFRLSHMTVNKAISSLVAKGILRREQGVGTFVAKTTNPKTVTVILNADTQCHEPLLSVLPSAMQEAGFNTMLIDNCKSYIADEMIFNAAENSDVLVVVPTPQFPYRVSRELPEKLKIIFVGPLEGKCLHPYSCVIPDLRQGAYEVASALTRLGRKNISALVFDAEQSRIHSLFHEGFARFRAESAENRLTCINPHSLDDTGLADLFQSSERPDAIFAFSDFIATRVISAVRKNNLSIPDDVAIVGCYNTPWAENLEMTSISVQPEKITAGILKLIEATAGKEIWIPTKMVFRASCPET